MEWTQAHLLELSALCGAVLTVWQLFGKLNKALISHLDDKFASKHDFERLEKKVDTMMVAVIRRSHSRRDTAQ